MARPSLMPFIATLIAAVTQLTIVALIGPWDTVGLFTASTMMALQTGFSCAVDR